MRRGNHAAERVIEEFFARILTQVLIQLRSDGLTEKGLLLPIRRRGKFLAKKTCQ